MKTIIVRLTRLSDPYEEPDFEGAEQIPFQLMPDRELLIEHILDPNDADEVRRNKKLIEVHCNGYKALGALSSPIETDQWLIVRPPSVCEIIPEVIGRVMIIDEKGAEADSDFGWKILAWLSAIGHDSTTFHSLEWLLRGRMPKNEDVPTMIIAVEEDDNVEDVIGRNRVAKARVTRIGALARALYAIVYCGTNSQTMKQMEKLSEAEEIRFAHFSQARADKEKFVTQINTWMQELASR